MYLIHYGIYSESQCEINGKINLASKKMIEEEWFFQGTQFFDLNILIGHLLID